jgi:hypothetical protein
MLAKVRDLVTNLISVKTSTPSTTALQMSSRPWLKTAIADGTDPACRVLVDRSIGALGRTGSH